MKAAFFWGGVLLLAISMGLGDDTPVHVLGGAGLFCLVLYAVMRETL